MPNYSVYNPNQAPRAMALDKLAMMSRQKQAFADQQYQKQLEAEAEAKRQAEEQANESSRNWLNPVGTLGMTGAGIGTAIAPGFGTAVGAIVGGAVGLGAGMYSSYKNRQEQNKGEGKWASLGKALAHPLGDKWSGMADVPIVSGVMPQQPQPMQGPGSLQAKQMEQWRNAEASAGMNGMRTPNGQSIPMSAYGSRPGLGATYGSSYAPAPAPQPSMAQGYYPGRSPVAP